MKHSPGGLWDVDGSGMQRIEDDSLAGRLLEKTNNMNTKIGLKGIAGTAVLTLIPELIKVVNASS